MSMQQRDEKIWILKMETAIGNIAKILDDKYDNKQDDASEFAKLMNEFEDLIDTHATRALLKAKWRAIDTILVKAINATSLTRGTEFVAACCDIRYELSFPELDYDTLTEEYYEARDLFDKESKQTIHKFDTTLVGHLEVNTKLMSRGVSTLEGVKEAEYDKEQLGEY
jgi:hypothetical protein